MGTKFEWRQINIYDDKDERIVTFRAKISAGWIVKDIWIDHEYKSSTQSMVFIPDLHHAWDIDDEQ